MSKMRSVLPGLVFLLVVSLGLAQGAAASDYTPDWTLGTADGGTVNFHETLAKGPVVVSFWATWCKPCLKEMPHLNDFAGEYAGQVTFLAVNADNSKSVAKVAPFLSSKGFDNLIVPLDTGGTLQSQMQIGGTIPFLVVYDGEGREVYRHVGYKPGDEVELKHKIEAVLAGGRIAAPTQSAQTAPAADPAQYSADWNLGTADGGTVNFHETLAKGPVVLSFWATWCKPCLKEMPHLNEYAGEYADQVTFLAVNADNSKSVAKVAPFLASKNYNNLIVPLDTGGILQSQLQIGGTIPFLILYDGQGREVYRHVGYKPGDEVELKHKIEMVLSAAHTAAPVATGKPGWAEAVTATDKFRYSYSTETEKEIFDNWFDVSYQFGGFRTGIMLRSKAPDEFGERENQIEHRFFEFDSSDFQVRVGHFYGIFGRGLIFNAYEDRVVRVDTRLDGIIGTTRQGNLKATLFSGSPSVQTVDVRAVDLEYDLPYKLKLGGTGLTYRPDDYLSPEQKVNRDWFYSARARQNFSFGDYYVEYGWRNLKAFDLAPEEPDDGKAYYANANVYQGPFSASWEHSHYERYAVVPNADGKTALNRPPSLTREFTWTLMNRDPHNLDQNNEKGNNLDLIFSQHDWTVVASGARLKQLSGETVYELGYGSIQKDHIGPWKVTAGFGYQEAADIRQTVVGEVVWHATETMSWTLQAEHQHVRLEGGYGYSYGEFDVDWFKLEFESAPSWGAAFFLETSNKYDEQPPFTEKKGPFPAAQVTYTISRGGNLNLWFGKRQAGYLCSGGVCKFEPAFEGIEFYGLFRY